MRDNCGRIPTVHERRPPASQVPQAETTEDGRSSGVPAGAAEKTAGTPEEDAIGATEAAEVGAASQGARGKTGRG